MLACVRNEDGLGSRVAGIRRARLAPRHAELLTAAEVAILPDDSYPGGPTPGPTGELAPVATLWRDHDGLCVRYDPSYSRVLSADPEFAAAYTALGRALDDCGETAPLAPGDLLVIDNDVAVHGRAAFRPRFDGTDRWLKRVLVRLPRGRPAREGRESGYAQEQATVVGWPT